MKNFIKTAAIFLMLCSAAFAGEIKFAQMSDVHYYSKATPEDKGFKVKYRAVELAADAISKINADKDIDLVLITGDAADRPIPADFETIYKLFNTLDKKWYYALGNHDTNTEFNKQKQVDLLKKVNPAMNFDKTYYSFKPKRGFTFIALDPTFSTKVSSQGYLPPEQLKFLDETLSKSQNDTVVVFMHFPLIEPFYSSNHNILNDFAVNDILKKYKNPILVLGGHYHGTKIGTDGNVVKVATPAIVSWPNAFRFITIDNQKDKTIFTFKYEETSLKDVQTEAAVRFLWLKTGAIGTEKDRDTVIVVEKPVKSKLGAK